MIYSFDARVAYVDAIDAYEERVVFYTKGGDEYAFNAPSGIYRVGDCVTIEGSINRRPTE